MANDYKKKKIIATKYTLNELEVKKWRFPFLKTIA